MDSVDPNIQDMKQEAIKYVNDMRAKSKFNSNTKFNTESKNGTFKDDEYKDKFKKNERSPIQDIFDALTKDSEKTIILVLILILTREGADNSIILALIYLLI